MPELPEVETIVRGLDKVLSGKKISAVKILNKKSFLGERSEILGKKIIAVRRRAKYIIFELERGKYLLIHLKMTGQLIWQSQKIPNNKVVGGHPDEMYRRQDKLPHKYTRVYFEFDDGSRLFFNDLRVFGWIKIVDQGELKTLLSDLGFEPLPYTKNDRKSGELLILGVSNLNSIIQKYPRRRIKDLLQDQKLIAGIGNIYSSEILFCAGVLPGRAAGSLTAREIRKIYQSINRVLSKAVKLGGTSMSDYRKVDGSKGGYLDEAGVYAREGEKCRKCAGKIKRKKIGQRSAYFCPHCQV
ncbi:MAG: formamidopyrimidine-DNA glycosylase [Candidatus Berkelbacteria bacterium Licking1014_7]|uniref:Formamidopyrimidine-DNA glycosylase n=1 Tax=Candidatus Berkelbacteria bacterium Licking1014_7 TaxID=2017147 RepID=A0A554LK82_9BACT|nr:MAG: formamidopyrimidine-DNA glycosylase [Candidatus Berkelbacteria bacterium Licking1014_7]